MVERLVRQMVTSISAAAAVSALRRTSSSMGPSVDMGDLNLLAVDDEARAFRDFIVERHRRQVGLVGLPVDARRAGFSRPLIDGLDQGATNAFAACRLSGEEVLQIAGRADHDGAAMKEIVNQTEKSPVLLGDHRMDRLIGVEEARPRHLGDLGRKGALVEAVVALPERRPLGEVGGCYGADDQLASHRGISHCIESVRPSRRVLRTLLRMRWLLDGIYNS